MITFHKKRHFCRTLFLTLVLLALPALAQTQFSGQITVNASGSLATLANPVYYNETINLVGVSTTGGASLLSLLSLPGAFPRPDFGPLRPASIGSNAVFRPDYIERGRRRSHAANPVYYNETINQVGVSTTGALSCAA
jgi:hypothetical protein